MVSIGGSSETKQETGGSGKDEAVATYLHEAVAKTLAEGIAATIKAQPEDPPLFLSRWLLQYVEERHKRLEASSTARKVASVKPETATGATQDFTPQLDLHGLHAVDDKAIKAFREVEWVEEETLVSVLNHLKESLGATGVYLAKYEEQLGSRGEDATASLRYIAADDSHSYMLNYCLHEDEGLTWDLLQEPGKELEGASKDSKEEEEEEDNGCSSEGILENPWASSNVTGAQIDVAVTHKSLVVEEVLDNPRVRFFGLTRPGSYIAVSIELFEVANTESVMAVFNWMKEKRAREEDISSSQTQDETVSSGNGESREARAYLAGPNGTEDDSNEDEDTLELADKPLAPPVLRRTPAKYVLCADSLGQEKSLGQEALRCIQLFAEEIGKTIVRTQREAVERQAAEMLSASERNDLDAELSELQKKCSMKLQQLQEQRQAEALQLLDEQEAEEMAVAERHRHEAELRQQEKAEAAKQAEKLTLTKEGEDDGGGHLSADSFSDRGESDVDGKSGEEIFIPPALPRQCVLEAVAAHAALEAFNEEVLTPFKWNLSLGRHYIADSARLVSVAAGCALLLGYEARVLKVKAAGKDALWNWNRLRQLLTPAFADEMLAFDPKTPRHYNDKENSLNFITEMLDTEFQGNDEQSQRPLENVLLTWVTYAVKARKAELVLQREKLRRAASMQHVPLPDAIELVELDSDFECVEDAEL